MPTLNLNYNIIEVQRRKAVGPYPIQMEYLIVAGGGGSWAKTGNDTVGGGGAGGYITGSYCFSPNETQTFTIGAGGALQTNGTNSTGFGLTAIGGGAAGANINGVATNANSGGSGGGGADGASPAGGIANQGFGGGSSPAGPAVGGGGGGGAAEVGYNAISTAGANGGNGKQWLDGTYYAGGGGGSNYKASGGSGGANGLGYLIGGGGGQGNPGTTGIVGLRYLTGERVVVTNGSSVNVGNFTYHYFTSGTGSIQFIGDEQQDPNINPCP